MREDRAGRGLVDHEAHVARYIQQQIGLQLGDEAARMHVDDVPQQIRALEAHDVNGGPDRVDGARATGDRGVEFEGSITFCPGVGQVKIELPDVTAELTSFSVAE